MAGLSVTDLRVGSVGGNQEPVAESDAEAV
jgi:hypothetical protein